MSDPVCSGHWQDLKLTVVERRLSGWGTDNLLWLSGWGTDETHLKNEVGLIFALFRCCGSVDVSRMCPSVCTFAVQRAV